MSCCDNMYVDDADYCLAAEPTDSYSVDSVAKEQIMQALRISDPEEYIIGVCGSYTVITHTIQTVIRLAEKDRLFDKIVEATVTKNLDVTNIQTQIGAAIGLNFDDEMDAAVGTTFCMCFGGGNNKKRLISGGDRASLLCSKLKELQSVLVVLYDINGRLDLGKLGISSGEDHNGCKILLTASNEEFLSNQMKPHQLIIHN